MIETVVFDPSLEGIMNSLRAAFPVLEDEWQIDEVAFGAILQRIA